LDAAADPGKPDLSDSPAAAICRRVPIRRNFPIARPPRTTAPAPRKRTSRKPPAAIDTTPPAPGTPRKKAAIAGPKPQAGGRKKAPAKVEAPLLERMMTVIVTSLEDDKAEEIVTIDLAGRATFADRMVIASGLADRQIAAMATHLVEKLAEIGIKRVKIEGATGADWVLIDAGDVIVHLFKPEARSVYGLEKMWGAEFDEPALGGASAADPG
jgi:ribosome-associated protein